MKKLLNVLRLIYHNERYLLATIFLASVLTSTVFVVFFRNVGPAQHAIPGTDYSSCYLPAAENILQGEFLLQSNGFIRCTAGYPLVILPVLIISKISGFAILDLLVIYNIFISAFSACFLYLLVKLVFSKPIALLSSLLWMSYPLNLWLVKNPNTEVPFIFLLLLGLYFYIFYFLKEKWRHLFLAGFVLGFASLVRPIGLLIPAVLSVLVFFLVKNASFKTRVLLFSLILLGNLAVIVPWEAYVFSEMGSLAPLSSIGPVGMRDGFTFGAQAGDGGDNFQGPQDVIELMERVKQAQVSDLKSYGEMLSVLRNEFVGHPITFMKLLFIKLFRSWYATSELWLEGKILLMQLPYLILSLLGSIFAFRFYKEKIMYSLVFWTIIMYFWFMTTITLSIVRYMIPVMPLVIIFSSIATYRLLLEKYLKKS